MIDVRDFKSIGGVVADYWELALDNVDNPEVSRITGAPSSQQNQNSSVEIKWKNITSLYRTWLTSNLLSTEFWYFAIKYAVQVINYIPFIKDNECTTSFQCIYKVKPDYRSIIPIFSIAYVKRFRNGVKHRSKAMSQSIKCVLVGNDSTSDRQLFYVPYTRSIMGSSD